MAVPCLAKGVTFGGFTCGFCDVFRRCVAVFVASTLDVSIVILRGRRSTLDVSCCMFFANRIVCVKWRQGANSLAGVAFCEM